MFAYTILYVQNVTESIKFYEKTFGLEKIFITPVNDYGEIATGGTKLAFASIGLANSNLEKGFQESNLDIKPFGIELAFTTDNVSETVQKALEAGGTIEAEIVTKSWGQTVAYVRDIDGFLVEICTVIKS